VDLASLVFTAGTPSYTITSRPDIAFWGDGVRNDSGVQQTFAGDFSFNGDSSAGDDVTYEGPGSVSFNDNASAGSASFDGQTIDFFDNASADDAVFTTNGTFKFFTFNNNSTAAHATFVCDPGNVTFSDGASAGDANFTFFGLSGLTANAGTLSHATVTVNGGAPFGNVTYIDVRFSATADHATLIANGGG
jgi:hypothetical protein